MVSDQMASARLIAVCKVQLIGFAGITLSQVISMLKGWLLSSDVHTLLQVSILMFTLLNSILITLRSFIALNRKSKNDG